MGMDGGIHPGMSDRLSRERSNAMNQSGANKNRCGRFTAFCRRHAFRPGRVLLFLFIMIFAISALMILTRQPARNVSKTTSFGLENIGELATQAGYFTTVQSIHKAREIFGLTIPLTESNYVYSYDGTIKAGIDFADVDMEVDDENHLIRIIFPEFRILSTEIKDDSFVVFNDGTNPFTSLKLEDVQRGNAQLKQEAMKTAIDNGILESARTNAEMLIRGFLAGAYDLNVYTIEFLSKT